MNISYENIIIRNAEESDAKILCKWWNDGKVMAHAGFPNGLGINEEEIIKIIKQDTDEDRRHIIEYNEDPIGEMSYRKKGEGIAEIGIKICDSSKQEKGIGSKVLKLFITSLFNNYAYSKIVLDTNLKNTRAQYVYEKLGFNKIKVEKDSWKNQNGELQSFVFYELNKQDFLGNS